MFFNSLYNDEAILNFKNHNRILQNGQILSHHVGLRPARSEIRIEAESLPSGQMVVHNYGHGGSGICLHWGCALEVANLVENIRDNSRNSSSRPVLSKL